MMENVFFFHFPSCVPVHNFAKTILHLHVNLIHTYCNISFTSFDAEERCQGVLGVRIPVLSSTIRI